MRKIPTRRGIKGAFDVAAGRSVAIKAGALDKIDELVATRQFEAAKMTGADGNWYGTSGDANFDIQAGLERLRQRSRDLYQNTGYGRTIIDTIVNKMVGTGIKPTPTTGDAATDERLWELWQGWGAAPVSGANLDIYGAQALMVRHWMLDGEGVIRFRSRRPDDMPGLPAFKLQMLEPDMLPVSKTTTGPNAKSTIVSGVEFDALGELTAYHFLKTHPGTSYQLKAFFSIEDTTRINERDVVHIFDIYRAGQVRGVPVLTPVMLTLWHLQGFERAVLIAARTVSCVAAVVTGGTENIDESGINVDNPPLTDADGRVIDEIYSGMVAQTSEGRTITFTDPKMPTGIKETITAFLREISAGVGLSYHTVSGDMSDSSFAQARLSLINEKVALTTRRELVLVPAMNKIYRRFVDECELAGLVRIPANASRYGVSWSTPRIPSADEETEVKTAILKSQLGLEALSSIMEGWGIDPDTEFNKIAADHKTLDDLGIVSIGDVSKVTTSGQFQASPQTPAP